MRYLIDTHILIWAVANPRKLSAKARKVLSESDAEYFFSAASVWEIAIKHLRHPDDIPLSAGAARRMFTSSGFRELPVLARHPELVENLADLHGDPFDRLLIAQARCESMVLVTHDEKVAAYGEGILAV